MIPEGVQTVTIEGRDLSAALQEAAGELGVEMTHVAHKIDLSHFRSATGSSLAKRTVQIIAWASEEPVRSVFKPREDKPRDERRSSDRNSRDRDGDDRKSGRNSRDRKARDSRDDSRRRDDSNRSKSSAKPDFLRPPEGATTEASDFAMTWFVDLLKLMDIEGNVVGTGSEDRVHLSVSAERAGRMIGKRGATLGAIRHLLGQALERVHGNFVLDVDVDDNRSKGGDRRRGDRKQGDRKGRGRSNDRSGDQGRYPEEKLRALARRAAEKVKETGQTITINLELNSYDRRIVHMEVATFDGVASHSEQAEGNAAEGGESRTKLIQVVPA